MSGFDKESYFLTKEQEKMASEKAAKPVFDPEKYKSTRDSQFNEVARRSYGIQPGEHARKQVLAAKLGLNPSTLETHLDEVEIRDLAERMRSASPGVKRFMMSDDNAKQSHDDIENLSALERLRNSGARGVDQLQGMSYGFFEALGEAIDSENLTQWGREGRTRNEQEAAENGVRQLFTEIEDEGDFGNWMIDTLGEQGPMMAPGLAGGLAGGAGGFAIGGPPGAAIGGVLGAFMPSFFLGVGETQGAIKEKDPETEAPGVAFAAGGLIGALDSAIPGKVGSKIAKTFGLNPADAVADAAVRETLKQVAGRVAKETAKGATIEGVTEAVQEAVVEVAASYATDTNIDPKELTTVMIEGFAAGFFMGGSVVSITETATAIKQMRAQSEAERIGETATAVQQSNLASNNKEKFREFLKQSGDDQIFIPAKGAMEILAEAETDPELSKSPTIKNISEQIDEATRLNSDVVLDASDVMADIMPNDALMESWQQWMKLSDDTSAAAEFDAETEAIQAKSARFMEQAEREAADKAAGREIYDKVYRTIRGQGSLPENQAKQTASVMQSAYETIGKNAGMSVDEFSQEFGFDIKKTTQGDLRDMSVLLSQQDFGDIELSESAELAETGEPVNIIKSAQKTFDQTAKRRDTVQKILGCLNG